LSLSSTWKAKLNLEIAREAGRSIPIVREHEGPLRLQKMLYPEGGERVHALIVHPPGGVVGGDELSIHCRIHPQAAALITSPGATKWYRSDGRVGRQVVHLKVDEGAQLEWLPQETIVFDQADCHWQTQVDLAPDARVVGLEVVILGRPAIDELFQNGRIANRLQMKVGSDLLYAEQWQLRGGEGRLSAMQGLQGHACFGQLWAVGPVDLIRSGLETLQLRSPQLGQPSGEVTAATNRSGVHWGASQLKPNLLIVRAIGVSTELVRGELIKAWQLIRPILIQASPTIPRIWFT
jgi:urease accessory protein